MIAELTRHLWQSTFFVLAVALLTLAFRGNRAQVRYWLWLSASIKFLLPFAVLTSVGVALKPWAPAAQRIASPAVSFVEEYVAQPFADGSSFVPISSHGTDWMSSILLGVWACGFLTIALVRFRSWLRIRAAVRASSAHHIHAGVEIRKSPGLLEPGVVGLLRPILLLPGGITEHLTPSELKAVLAHELCHVRRRDNLFAAIHMTVETMFWFHPLVWWIGARLVEERERACDEQVLSEGNAPDVYADAILSVCKLYVESPLTCVSGVSGASIRRRIEAIMSNRRVQGLSRVKKSLLASAGIAALAGPITIGLLISVGHVTAIRAQSPAPKALRPVTVPAAPVQMAQLTPTPAHVTAPRSQPVAPMEFDAASIRLSKDDSGGGRSGPVGGAPLQFTPSRVASRTVEGVTARRIILDAYHVLPYQLSGGPSWIDSDRFDLEARSETPTDDDHLRLMLQMLLSRRFNLALHHESREIPVYALTVGKNGLKLHELKDGDPAPSEPENFVSADAKSLHLAGTPAPMNVFNRVSIDSLAGAMSTNRLANLDRPVVDKTGLQGLYSFTFMWDPNEDYKSAVEQELGLKFIAQKDAVDILVIDSVERPSEN